MNLSARTRVHPLSLALALVLLAQGACRRSETAAVKPSVASLEVIRGSADVEHRGRVDAVRTSLRVPNQAVVEVASGARALLRLDGGALVVLDQGSLVEVSLTELELRRGRAFVDARSAPAIRLITPHGSLTAAGAAYSVALDARRTVADCAAGEVTYQSPRGSDRFAQGERLVLASGAPTVDPADVLDDWTGGFATPVTLARGTPSYVGDLFARSPGTTGVAGEPMSLRSHELSVTVVDDFVRTEVVQTFFNGESEVVDGEYGMRLPEGAVLEDFAVDVGQGFVPSRITALADSPGIFPAQDGAVRARVAYEGPDVLRARLRELSAGQTVRVRVVHTSWLARRGSVRTLRLPLAGDAEPRLVGELSVRVDASRSRAARVAAGYGATTHGKVVAYRASDVRPRADFVVELGDAEPRAKAFAYTSSRVHPSGRTDRFVRIDVPTELLAPSRGRTDQALDLLVVVDTSGGVERERLELARATVEAILAQLTPNDRIAVQLADVHVRRLAETSATPIALNASARVALLEALARAETGGATDLGTVLREASEQMAGRPAATILYIGDGLPTDGAMSATGIRRQLELVDDPPRLFAMGVGESANLGLLRSLLGDGVYGVRDRDEAGRAVLSLLMEAGRPVLRDVRFELEPSLEQVYPRGRVVVPLGGSTSIVARLVGPLPARLDVSARFGGETLTRAFPVEAHDDVAIGDAAKRWASERLAELLDEDAGREAVVELGRRFDLLTPYTSRVVGYAAESTMPWRGLDVDAGGVAWALSGGRRDLSLEDLGARRGFRAYAAGADEGGDVLLESTFVDPLDAEGATGAGDGGLGRVAVARTLALGGRGPRGCFDRRLLVRPDLRGEVTVRITVDGNGTVTAATIVRSTLGVSDVDRCVLDEVVGLAFPPTAGASVTIEHTFVFTVPGVIGGPRSCSLAAARDLPTRRRLWAERLEVARVAADPATAVLDVVRNAQLGCELPDWRSKRALLDQALGALPPIEARLAFYRGFADDPVVGPYLRHAILRRLRHPVELAMARSALGLSPELNWVVFARDYRNATTVEAKVALVRRWLEVAPDDLALRLRLLALLEQARALPEARRVARSLHEDPLADARVRTLVGEFHLRTGARDEAVRVFSELVERAPLDPWARRRLGDLYLTYGFLRDALREYETLARLLPDDTTVLLLRARAAAADGRIDEALRLEQRVSEETDEDVDDGLAAAARAYTTVRLAELRAAARDPAARALLDARLRETGVLRRPPAVVATLVWDHPDERLTLAYRRESTPAAEPPIAASVDVPVLGVASFRFAEPEPEAVRVFVRRGDVREMRDVRARLVVTEGLGTPEERTTVREVHLESGQAAVELPLRG